MHSAPVVGNPFTNVRCVCVCVCFVFLLLAQLSFWVLFSFFFLFTGVIRYKGAKVQVSFFVCMSKSLKSPVVIWMNTVLTCRLDCTYNLCLLAATYLRYCWRACHSPGIFFSLWHTRARARTHTHTHTRTHTHTHAHARTHTHILATWSVKKTFVVTHFSLPVSLSFQLLDLPGIIEGAKDGKGRGRQVIAGQCNFFLGDHFSMSFLSLTHSLSLSLPLSLSLSLSLSRSPSFFISYSLTLFLSVSLYLLLSLSLSLTLSLSLSLSLSPQLPVPAVWFISFSTFWSHFMTSASLSVNWKAWYSVSLEFHLSGLTFTITIKKRHPLPKVINIWSSWVQVFSTWSLQSKASGDFSSLLGRMLVCPAGLRRTWLT